MKKKSAEKRTQYGALPFKLAADGSAEIILITSRETQRWIIPKGWPMKGRSPAYAAEQEAFEEAGLVGDIGLSSLGSYSYVKRLKNGSQAICEVDVFPLRVREQLAEWPEMSQRQVRSFTLIEAVEAVDEPSLAALFDVFATELDTGNARFAVSRAADIEQVGFASPSLPTDLAQVDLMPGAGKITGGNGTPGSTLPAQVFPNQITASPARRRERVQIPSMSMSISGLVRRVLQRLPGG